MCVCCQVKYTKLREDWTLILELLRQHKERAAALLVAKKASKNSFSSARVCARVRAFISLHCTLNQRSGFM